MLRPLLKKLVAVLRRRRLESELDEEIHSHLEMAVQEYLARGMSPKEAEAAARRDFGRVERARERHRDVRSFGWLENLLRDLKFAARGLRKRPGFASVAVLTLALGIGATAAVFSLVHGVLLTPPPYDDPEDLVLITPASIVAREEWPAEQWMEWREEARTFETIAGYRWTFDFLISESGGEAMEGMRVTRDYFRATGLQPAIGRLFDNSETGQLGAPAAILLGHEFWMRRFGGDPDIIGTTIRLGQLEAPPVVIGIMPPGVRFLPSERSAEEPNYDADALVDFWLPTDPGVVTSQEYLERPIWSVIGRVADGVTLEDARQELEVLTTRQITANPEHAGRNPQLVTLSAAVNREGRRILLPLLGAAALVLLIACGNAATLLLVRGLQRQREYGVRSAIGAGRGALLRLVTVESLLLAFVGGLLGVALALGVINAFKQVGGEAIPRLDAVSMGWPVLAFGLGAALLSALLAGVYPAFRAWRQSEVGALKDAGLRTSAGRGERRLLAGVTIVQAALTLALLVGAGLLIRTMSNLARVDAGYATEHIVTMNVMLARDDWEGFHRLALERVAGIPGVEAVAFAWGVPLTGNNWPRSVQIEGAAPTSQAGEAIPLPFRSTTPGYFGMFGRAITRGRDFRSSDELEAPRVAIVNETFVDRYLDGRDPLGVRLVEQDWPGAPFEIAGVVSDGRTDDLTRSAAPEVYVSFWQIGADSKHLVARTSGDPEAVGLAIQRVLLDVDPTVGIDGLRTMAQIRSDSQASRRFASQLLIAFALIACLLTVGGIYGVLSLSVTSRRREIAIRTAVGAARGNVLGLVIREGLSVIAVGMVAGLAASVALSQILGFFLYGVEPTDPGTLVAVGTSFAAISLLACWIPAKRAAAVDPVEVLREQ